MRRPKNTIAATPTEVEIIVHPAAIARLIPELKPVKLTGTMAFMFETRFLQRVTTHAAKLPSLQKNYIGCWDGLPKRFNPKKKQAW